MILVGPVTAAGTMEIGRGMRLEGPTKRSMMIAGHATSISLEPIFWDALREAAEQDGLPVNALVARIDAERVERPDPPNLASAIRVWLFERRRG
jgi:predicted DNA-binding ribbon-helix-helix protein